MTRERDIIPGVRPVLGTSFVWPPPAACCRCRLQRSDAKKAPRAQGAFGAEGSGCLCVLMARAWRLVLHEAFAASHSPPHTQAAGLRALLPPGQCAAWQQAGMRGLALRLGPNHAGLRASGRRAEGWSQRRKGGCAAQFFFQNDKAGSRTHAAFLGFRAEDPQGPQNNTQTALLMQATATVWASG